MLVEMFPQLLSQALQSMPAFLPDTLQLRRDLMTSDILPFRDNKNSD